MRIGYMSDLHLRYNENHEEFIASLEPNVDVQIIAGDCIDGAHDIGLLKDLLRRFKMPVIFVLGNHEYFKDVHPTETEELIKGLEKEFANLKVLISEDYQIPDGPRVLGTTLWYQATPDIEAKHFRWADFRYIRDLSQFAMARFEEDNLLLKSIKPGDVVVTHMLPTWKSVASKFAFAKTNELFVRNVEPLIIDNKPAFWIHGHTHTTMDYMLEETRVLCNPRGIEYSDGDNENPFFDVNKFFEWNAP